MKSIIAEQHRGIIAYLAAALALLTPLRAIAGECSHWDDLQPVANARLAALRGGFENPLGMKLDFGFERAVYVNGELVASSRLTISDLGNLSTGVAPSATSTLTQSANSLPGSSGVQSVQVPSANGILSGVQNTLNNQLIQVRTTIDATLSSITQLRTQLFSDAFRQSAIDSARR
jgi:hypothetical protein